MFGVGDSVTLRTHVSSQQASTHSGRVRKGVLAGLMALVLIIGLGAPAWAHWREVNHPLGKTSAVIDNVHSNWAACNNASGSAHRDDYAQFRLRDYSLHKVKVNPRAGDCSTAFAKGETISLRMCGRGKCSSWVSA